MESIPLLRYLVEAGLGSRRQVVAAIKVGRVAVTAGNVYDEIFRLGCYDGIRLPPQPLVIDVGANIGMFALFVKLRVPGTAEILAIPRP